MMSLLMEAVVISFSIGAIMGGVVTLHLVQPKPAAAKGAAQSPDEALER